MRRAHSNSIDSPEASPTAPPATPGRATASGLFGTDGIRGTANVGAITPEKILALAMAAAQYFNQTPRHRLPLVVMAKDTRLSGYMLENAMTAGFLSMGFHVRQTGPLPTPALALLTRSMGANLGVMLSASHNPWQDNGVKFFSPHGLKLSDEVQKKIEALMANQQFERASPDRIGRSRRIADASGRYIELLKASLPAGLDLSHLKIALDCAHGACYRVAPTLLEELGAQVVSIGIHPNGENINHQCGATQLETLRATVLESEAALGIALDGDADRVVMLDHQGRTFDGDALLGLLALDWHRRGRLSKNIVCGTMLSNLGLEHKLLECGLQFHRCQVGDRYLAENMRELDADLGSEPSGHLVLRRFNQTGDGLLAALQVLAVMWRTGKTLNELAACFEPVPQIHLNIPIERPTQDLRAPEMAAALAAASRRLDAKRARLVARPSGTQALVRLMGEGTDTALVRAELNQLAAVFKRL